MDTKTDRLISKMAWIVTAALCAIIIVYGFYFFNFFSEFKLSDQTGVWGTFGDYVGGILNPIFGFLTLIALLLTLNLQREQLKISNEELEHSREELKASRELLEKSSEAQELTAKSLAEQTKYAAISAKLNALNASLAVITELIDQQRNGVVSNPDAYQALVKRKETIAADILVILRDI